ncbi:MAG: glycosyltransferase family 39 protein [Candidatus Omnitrophica bacterium]|nr:glycosyltransferase family 39 protein [Candidatus Omnitrophota bacterium]MDD5591853.1 glycosyltransferase family 39 protein [Candidatus Omnitrophota bacterium]
MARIKINRVFVLIVSILFIATLVRAVVFIWGAHHHSIEVYEYEEIATNLIQGKGFLLPRYNAPHYSAIAPLFPYLCALVYLLFGHEIAYIIWLQIIFNVLMCYIIFCIGKTIFDKKVGLLSMLLVALHPGLIVYSTLKVHSLSLYALLISAIVWMVIKNYNRASLKNKIILGVCLGLGALERPTLLAFLPVIFLWFYYYQQNRKETLKIMLYSVCIVAIFLLPWSIRNLLRYKQFFLIQTNQWEGLWIGNNPHATGTLYLPNGTAVFETSPAEFKQKLYTLDEMGQMDLFKDTAIGFIKENPLKFLILTSKKIFYFWWFSPQSGILYPSRWLGLYKAYYTIMIIFASIGFWLAFIKYPLRKFVLLLVFFLFALSILQSFYYAEGRHRWSVEALILILASFGIASVFLKLRTYFKKRACFQ